MTAPAGFLDFFVLEAGEYIEQLDGLLLTSNAGTPDAEALQRVARALRGSATMAKLSAFAEMAAGIERVGRGLRGGTTRWEPALTGALVAAIPEIEELNIGHHVISRAIFVGLDTAVRELRAAMDSARSGA